MGTGSEGVLVLTTEAELATALARELAEALGRG